MGRFRTGVKRSVNRTKAWGSKHSPEILICVGIAASIGAIGMAIKATIDIRDEWDDLSEDIDDIKVRFDKDEEIYEVEYEDEEGDIETEILEGDEAIREYRKDLVKAHGRRVLCAAKHYAIPLVLEGAAIGTIFGSNKISRKRNATLTTALAFSDAAYNKLRANVEEAYGKEEADRLERGIKKEKIVEEVVGKNGKTKEKVTEKEFVDDSAVASQWAIKLTPETVGLMNFHNDWKHYEQILRIKESYWSNVAVTRSYEDRGVFWNEIAADIGIPGKQIGQLYGWKFNKYDKEPDYVDLGIKVLDASEDDYLKFGLTKVIYLNPKPRKIINECYREFWDPVADADNRAKS